MHIMEDKLDRRVCSAGMYNSRRKILYCSKLNSIHHVTKKKKKPHRQVETQANTYTTNRDKQTCWFISHLDFLTETILAL